MDDKIEFAIALLKLVAKDLQSIADEQRTEILDGTAKIRLVVESKSPKKPEKTIESALSFDELRTQLENCNSRDDAHTILVSLGASKTALQKLCRQFDLPAPKDDDAKRLIDRIVESVVGFRLRSNAIQGKNDPQTNNAEQGLEHGAADGANSNG